ncbi:MAG: hypothetical protein AVDCRST_MAG18-3663, partial [uncultured Thermomicrobiales bacterium]
ARCGLARRVPSSPDGVATKRRNDDTGIHELARRGITGRCGDRPV